MSDHRRRRYKPPSLFWPLILIGVGIVFLLVNFDYLQVDNVWVVLYRFWPVLLILVGIDVLFGSRSTLGAAISAVMGIGVIAAIIALIWYAPQIPSLSNLTTSPERLTERVSRSLEGIDEATVVIDVGRGTLDLGALRESASLIEADVSHYGELRFDVSRRGDRADVKMDVHRPNPLSWLPDKQESWDVRVSTDVEYDLDLDLGSGTYDVDLGDLEVAELLLDQGSGNMTLALPASGDVEVEIDLGSGELDISLPDSMEARVDLDKGSGDFSAGSRFTLERGRETGDGIWETDDYGRSSDRVTINIDMGSGQIDIR